MRNQKKRGLRAHAELLARKQLKEEAQKGWQGEFSEQLLIDLELPIAEMAPQSRRLVKERIKKVLMFLYSVRSV